MSKTIIVGGFGPGMSTSIAEKFGAEGFAVALVARDADRLGAGVKALEQQGVKAAAFPTDLGDPTKVRALVGHVRERLGPITVLQWSAWSNGAGDLLAADDSAIHGIFGVSIAGLLAAVQVSLPDLKKEKGAVLIANGGLGQFDPKLDALAVQFGSMGLAVANSAKHKLAGLLYQKLKADGVYVGEVIVHGVIKHSAHDPGSATIEPKTIANKFWELYSSRTEGAALIE
jgi:short-subunit dehydrogenase